MVLATNVHDNKFCIAYGDMVRAPVTSDMIVTVDTVVSDNRYKAFSLHKKCLFNDRKSLGVFELAFERPDTKEQLIININEEQTSKDQRRKRECIEDETFPFEGVLRVFVIGYDGNSLETVYFQTGDSTEGVYLWADGSDTNIAVSLQV